MMPALTPDQMPYFIVLALAAVIVIGAVLFHRYRDKSR